MGGSLTLFRIAGIEVRMHWSFLLIILYGAFIFGAGGGNMIVGAFYGVLVILLLFVCVTLHEFGHALVAKHFGVNTPYITLLPIGGVASLERMPDNPSQEFLIAIAGPTVNFIIALILTPITLAVAAVQSGPAAAMDMHIFTQALYNAQTPGLVNLLGYLVMLNLLLGLFNLLPAFPMDGGRILRSLLAIWMSYVQATRVAVFVGQVMAALFVVWGIFGGNFFLLLIAFFIYFGGGGELASVESRAVLKNVPVHRALRPNAVSLYVSEHIDRAVDLAMHSHQSNYPVMDLGGDFVGVLTHSRLVHGLREGGPNARVVDYMIPADQIPVCRPDDDLADVWEKMSASANRVMAVMDGARFLGLLSADDITEMIHVMGAAMNRSRRQNAGHPDADGPTSTGDATTDARV